MTRLRLSHECGRCDSAIHQCSLWFEDGPASSSGPAPAPGAAQDTLPVSPPYALSASQACQFALNARSSKSKDTVEAQVADSGTRDHSNIQPYKPLSSLCFPMHCRPALHLYASFEQLSCILSRQGTVEERTDEARSWVHQVERTSHGQRWCQDITGCLGCHREGSTPQEETATRRVKAFQASAPSASSYMS